MSIFFFSFICCFSGSFRRDLIWIFFGWLVGFSFDLWFGVGDRRFGASETVFGF